MGRFQVASMPPTAAVQEMRRETMKMFSRGLPLWQRLLMPTLGAGLVDTMKERLRVEGRIWSNMKTIEKTFG